VGTARRPARRMAANAMVVSGASGSGRRCGVGLLIFWSPRNEGIFGASRVLLERLRNWAGYVGAHEWADLLISLRGLV
jgi:hypothetical protein